jgi:hypothetical protein
MSAPRRRFVVTLPGAFCRTGVNVLIAKATIPASTRPFVRNRQRHDRRRQLPVAHPHFLCAERYAESDAQCIAGGLPLEREGLARYPRVFVLESCFHGPLEPQDTAVVGPLGCPQETDFFVR